MGRSYAQVVEKGLVVDKASGYPSWVRSDPQIVNWPHIEAYALKMGFRVIRNFGKAGARSIDPQTMERLRTLVDGQDTPLDQLEMVRGLLKILGDRNAADQLKLSEEAGIFQRWSPQLGEVIKAKHAGRLDALIGSGEPIERLGNLLSALEPSHRFGLLHELWAAHLAVPTRWTMQHIQRTLREVGARTGWPPLPKSVELTTLSSSEAVRTPFLLELHRVASSPALSKAERRDLFIRAVLRRSDRPKSLVQDLLPRSSPKERERLLDAAREVRAGRLVGLIDPIHHGHRDAVLDAIHNHVLDDVWVLPTSDSTLLDGAAAWEHKVAMAKTALAFVPEVSVAEKAFRAALHRDTGEGIQAVVDSYGRTPVHWTEINVGASTRVRQLRPGEASLDKLVSRSTAEYIRSHRLYRESEVAR